MNKHVNEELTLVRSRVLALGERVHVIARRTFEKVVQRHFAGTVTAVSDSLIRAEATVCDPVTLRYARRSRRRTRISSLVDATVQITVLPPETRIDRPEYAFEDGRLAVSDGEIVALEINEYDASS